MLSVLIDPWRKGVFLAESCCERVSILLADVVYEENPTLLAAGDRTTLSLSLDEPCLDPRHEVVSILLAPPCLE